jgi:N-methylhydantoinase B
LRLPFVKLFVRGHRQAPIFDILAANVRLPDLVMGDLHAQIAACAAGHRGLLALVERYGATTLAAYAARLQDYAEVLARAAIAAILMAAIVFPTPSMGWATRPNRSPCGCA